MRCDAPSFSLADYNFIMQCRDERPRSKVLNKLKEKYSTSQKRIYQIWRGEEKNRVAWDQPIYSFNSEKTSTKISENSDRPEGSLLRNNTDFQNEYNSTILALENSVNKPLSYSKIKHCEKTNSESLNISKEDLNAFYEKEAIRDKKNIAKYKQILAK
jgi:hypothetical protein